MRRSNWMKRVLRVCTRGAVLAVVAAVVAPLAFAADPEVRATVTNHMFVTTRSGQVIRADLDGTNPVVLPDVSATGVLGWPFDIALDTENGRMYIVSPTGNPVGNKVVRANLDGSSPTNLILGGILSGPQGLALDLSSNQMYIANGNGPVIRSDLNGTVYSSLGNLGSTLAFPFGIALDLVHGKMYVANNGNGTITQANLDGTGAVVMQLQSQLLSPMGVALDLVNNKLYVASRGNNSVVRANLDGDGVENLGNLSGTLIAPVGIALDLAAGKMYVTSSDGKNIVQANLNGTGVVNLGNLGGLLATGSEPFGIALDRTWPELTASAGDDVDHSISLGHSYAWKIGVSNQGTGSATFAAGQVILRDHLPGQVAYGTVAVQNVLNVANSGNLVCAIQSQVLTCKANGGPVTLGRGMSRFDIVFYVTPSTQSILANPTGGMCRVDPDNVIAEPFEINNDCGDSVTVGPRVAGQRLYVTDLSDSTIVRANLDGTGAGSFNVGSPSDAPMAIAIDSSRGKMYVPKGNNSVMRANLDGSGATALNFLDGRLNFPMGIALDRVNRNIYITNAGNNTLVRAGMDGTGVVNLGDLGVLNQPTGIAVDPVVGIFVANVGNNTLVRAGLDGGGPTTLSTPPGTINSPTSMALDVDNSRIYVVNGSGSIFEGTLTGTLVLTTTLGGLSSPYGIALDTSNGRMYVTGSATVYSANLDGTLVTNLGNLGGNLGVPRSIALDLGPRSLFLPLLVK